MRDKRLWLTGLLVVSLALSFWLVSRYPALHDKAEAGPTMVLDGIGFDTVYPVLPGDSLGLQVGKRTVNWVQTNRKGMLFGLLMSAGLATGLPLLGVARRRRWRDTMLGVALGAPMGLCVNCAAPLATSLRSGQAAEETLLAAVLSSPTLNFVVISILFAMLPWHLAMIKLVGTLAFVLLGVPAIAALCRDKLPPAQAPGLCDLPWNGSWGAALIWLGQHFGAQFLRLSVRLIPLMLLAGLLGSLLVSLLPWEHIRAHAQVSPFSLAVVALVGTFLPVPMAFDVILCGLLYQAGMAVEYVMTLLFTLGSFSFLTFSVFWTTVSRRMAVITFVAVAGLGWLLGLLAGTVDGRYRQWLDGRLVAALAQATDPRPAVPQVPPGSDFSAPLEEGARHAFRPSQGSDPTLFTRLEGASLGLSTPQVISYREHQSEPALANRSLASGDIHRDGWVDVVLAHDFEVGGASLFANQGGRFVRQRLDLGVFNHVFLPVVALVDVDGDGWLDLFFSTFHGQNRLLLNQGGRFGKMVELPSLPGAFVSAAGFADLDRDGRVDLVLGSWVHRLTRTGLQRLTNYTLKQTAPLQFRLEPLPLPGGNTQALLISDLNDDGRQDLILGNDWGPADEFYLGGPQGFRPLDRRVIPRSTEWTMSIDAADLNNDGRLEIFLGHIAYPEAVRERSQRERAARVQKLDRLLPAREVGAVDYMRRGRVLHENLRYRQDPVLVEQASWLQAEDRKEALLDILYYRIAGLEVGESPAFWEGLVPAQDEDARSLFLALFPQAGQPPRNPPGFQPFPSSRSANVLLTPDGNGYRDAARDWGLEFTNWGWNARFADLNGDGWQDLFVVNGAFEQELLTSNLLYLNRQGQRLEAVSGEGTEDYFPCSNYTYLDYDGDGDLDILLNPPNGEVRVLRNNSQGGHWLALDLEKGLGARVRLRLGDRWQQREVRASGGFDSFDGPLLHFGLGAASQADELEIRWPDGRVQRLPGPWPAGFRYRLSSTRTTVSTGGFGKS
jgi:uncharacterized membrane protein YraQ (UPF0718 family)